VQGHHVKPGGTTVRSPRNRVLRVRRMLDPSGDDRVLATRVAAMMMLLGAVLTAVTVVTPPGARGSDLLVLGLGALAAVVGVGLLLARRVSEPVLGAAVALGTAVITIATVEGGPGRGTQDNEVLFLWVVAYSFWFLRLPHALGQLGLVGIADAIRLADQGSLDSDAATRWLVTMSTYLVVGLLIAWLRGRLERQREERARLAVVNERMRIATELHDSTGHGVNVMSIQAAAALKALDNDPDKARELLEAIKTTARETAEDMRRMLGVLRERELTADELARSSLTSLGPLVVESHEAGVPVDISIKGEPVGLPSALDQAAYRVVQEALANIRAHAGEGTKARVTVTYDARDVDLEILDDGRNGGADYTGDEESLIGMRERVAAFDGELETSPLAHGGFRVHARFPLG
jgi:signal transduction histidine kinase